jgi:protein required for attachment to host cells
MESPMMLAKGTTVALADGEKLNQGEIAKDLTGHSMGDIETTVAAA